MINLFCTGLSILKRFQKEDTLATLSPVTEPARIMALQQARREVLVAAPVKEYIASLVGAMRVHPALRFGAIPRASIHLMRTAQALAALQGRHYVIPDDVKRLAGPRC